MKYKKDAARILLLEIENAERSVDSVRTSLEKDNPSLDENIFLMPTASWNDHKYLFVRDLERNEWDNLNNFYRNCLRFDQAVHYNNSFFEKNEEQIRSNIQRGLADYIADDSDKSYLEAQGDKVLDEPIEKQRKPYKMALAFQKRYLNFGVNYPFWYNPQKPITDATAAVKQLTSNISQTSTGTKMKILSKHAWPISGLLIWFQGGRD